MVRLKIFLILALPIVIGGIFWWISYRKKRRRQMLLGQPFLREHAQVLTANLPVVEALPEELRMKLNGLINVFLDEKRFTGCQGLEIDDEVRVTIAAQACLLILNNQSQNWYNRLHTILVYPSAYVARSQSVNEAGFVEEGDSVRLGESWGGGAIVLAWDSSRHGGVNFRDGQNVVIHEFAHQLDQIDGAADGTPTLGQGNCYQTWARVLGEEYQKLVLDKRKRRKTLLDTYGATNTAEFFAVSSECFFEKSKQLAKKHPELFEELKAYYGVDPRDWVKRKAT